MTMKQCTLYFLIHSFAMKSIWLHAFLWNSLAFPDEPVYANAMNPTTATPSLLHQSEYSCCPRGVANRRRLCCFTEIKPAAIAAFSTGCPIAPTPDHSADFQMWVLYL